VAAVRLWETDPSAGFKRRLGKTAAELGDSRTTQDCPDIWELDNGDIAVIGRDQIIPLKQPSKWRNQRSS
jgi:hypothetical protein